MRLDLRTSPVLALSVLLVGLAGLVAACSAAEEPNPALKLVEEADELRGLGEHAEAIARYEEAVELQPQFSEAFLGLAISYSAIGNVEEAERYYLLADAEDSENIQVKLNLAGFYYRNRNYERALWALQKALDIAPEGDDAQLVSGLWARVETAQVRATVRQNLLDALAENPDDTATIASLSDSYSKEAADLLQGNNARESLAVVTEGLERVPEVGQAGLYYVGAQAHGSLGDDSKAFEWLGRAVELNDAVPVYHLSYAGFFIERREWEAALAELDRVIELAPASEEAEFARIRKRDVEHMQQVPEERLEEYLEERRGKAPKKGSGPSGR